MSDGIRTIIFPVSDLGKAKALHAELLGVQPETDEPYYVGFAVDGQQVGLDPSGHRQGLKGPVGYVHVDDIATRVRELVAAGRDAPGGQGCRRRQARRDAADGDGNVIGLIQG